MNLAGFYIPGGALVGKNAAPCVAASDENVPVERSGHRIVVANGHIWLVGGFNPALDEPVIQRYPYTALTNQIRVHLQLKLTTMRFKKIVRHASCHPYMGDTEMSFSKTYF